MSRINPIETRMLMEYAWQTQMLMRTFGENYGAAAALPVLGGFPKRASGTKASESEETQARGDAAESGATQAFTADEASFSQKGLELLTARRSKSNRGIGEGKTLARGGCPCCGTYARRSLAG